MFKVNIKDSRGRSGVFLVNFEHVLHVILMSILLTLNRYMFSRNPRFNTTEEQNDIIVLLPSLLILNIFHTLF